ncbi:uncharacterized protein (DUF58 family) [Haloferula luteola]|uniref:Uncharacterized protein (DUF58 family) n=1 Tax=Haloferula luteola TaxID=595692 RepID=A0A840VB22_9BACT|nr:DUF58 domain-containing protein [Haloferula luteola]MBB5350091.1 uncharacterized protein (DUF58 family) [Haloferula luteola]
MNQDQLVACHHRALAAAGRLRLPFRSRVWRGAAGEFGGAGAGSSLDFQDHRTYVPGDDPRHINWQAYARTGSYTMKLYREEVRPTVDVIMDTSESMFFDPGKATRSAELLYLATESSRAAGAAVAVHLIRGSAMRTLPLGEVFSHRWLETARALASSEAGSIPDLSRTPLRPNALRVWISDLLYEADPEPLLRVLAARHGIPLLFAPFARCESDPDWNGNLEMIDAENGNRHAHRIDPPVLKRYKEAYVRHFAVWKSTSLRHRAIFARVSAEPDLATALYAEAVPSGALESSLG